MHNREYIGIKAVNNKNGVVVYYPPVELITLAGKVDRALEHASQENNPYWIIGTVGLCCLVCLLIAWRRYHKDRIPIYGRIPDTYDD